MEQFNTMEPRVGDWSLTKRPLSVPSPIDNSKLQYKLKNKSNNQLINLIIDFLQMDLEMGT